MSGSRQAVIGNIRSALEAGDFYRKVELNDPVLTREQCREITDRYLSRRSTPSCKLKAFLARRIANAGSRLLNRDMEIIGEDRLPDMSKGVIITSNHFSPLENTVIRSLVLRHGCKRLNIVSQVTNFAMTGIIGWLMNYADTIPISEDARYLTRGFMDVLGELVGNNEPVLIYPEQEMWFNYRKPRPPKRGAYHFAVKLGVPVISCFVELIDTGVPDKEGLNKVKYRLYILDTIYPDKKKGSREASEELCQRDYALKKAAYEKIYSKPLDYAFSPDDIAGLVRTDE